MMSRSLPDRPYINILTGQEWEEFKHCDHWLANVGRCCFCKRQRMAEDDDHDCTTQGHGEEIE